MPRKTLAKWIMVIGLLEIFLLFSFALWGGNFDPIITINLIIPTVAISVVWWKKKKGSWISSLLLTWLLCAIAPMLYATFYWEELRSWSLALWVLAVYSMFFGTILFTALMVPTGIVYAATVDMFKQQVPAKPRPPFDENAWDEMS